jgi:DNA polymerase-3 subunit chi
MPQVEFHFNAPDKLNYVCRLLRKAVSQGAKMGVLTSPQSLPALDDALWKLLPTDFLPHCLASDEPPLLAHSCVIRASETSVLAGMPNLKILLNLQEAVPSDLAHFERVIEVVGQDEQDKAMARLRWKHYASCDMALLRHDLKT